MEEFFKRKRHRLSIEKQFCLLPGRLKKFGIPVFFQMIMGLPQTVCIKNILVKMISVKSQSLTSFKSFNQQFAVFENINKIRNFIFNKRKSDYAHNFHRPVNKSLFESFHF